MNACSLEQASPSDYTDAFYREQMKIKEILNQLAKTNDPNRQNSLLNEFQSQSEKSLARINEVGSFRGDEQLFNAGIILFEFYLNLSNELAENGLENLASNLDSSRQIIADQEHAFFKAQAKFAEDYELFL